MPNPILIGLDYFKIVRSNIYSNFGPFEQSFRKTLKEYTGNKSINFVTTSSATAGIQIAVENIFHLPEKRPIVLMPSFSFASAACVFKSLGYNISFYDIDPNTLQPDIESAKNMLEHRKNEIAGVLYCNSFGVGLKENFKEWAKHTGSIPIIIDSAAGFGSIYEDGAKLGSLGECEIFSFHATKTMAVGEGGAISTTSKSLATKLKNASNFGFDSSRSSKIPGTNAKLQELSAAIGIRQLKKLDKSIRIKQKNVLLYTRMLDKSVSIQQGSDRSSLAFLTILLPTEAIRNKCLYKLSENGVMCRTYYAPLLSEQAMFNKEGLTSSLKNTKEVSRRILSVPIHHRLTSSQIKEICDTINQML